MKSVIMHLHSGVNTKDKDCHVVLFCSDDSAEVRIFTHKIDIVKGTIQQFVEMLFKYFFLTDHAKKMKLESPLNNKLTVYSNLDLDICNYTVTCRCKPPDWWDEFQEKLEKYKNLLVFM